MPGAILAGRARLARDAVTKAQRIRTLVAGLLAVLTLDCAAKGKETTTYDIAGAWFDDDTIYLRYQYHYTRLPEFSFEIRGTPVESRTAHFILTLPRARAAMTAATIRLAGGDPADAIEYRDRELQVERRNDLLVVKGREHAIELKDCLWPLWRDSGIAATSAGLLVCGTFVDRSGRVQWQLPPDAVLRLGERLAQVNQRGPDAVAKAAPVLAPTFAGGTLLVTTDWTGVHPERVLIAALEPANLTAPAFKPSAMAAASSYFGLQSGRRVYSPGGAFVVDNGTRSAPSFAVCDMAACAPLPLPGRPAYLLVDHPRREAYYFGQASTLQPEVEVRRIAY